LHIARTGRPVEGLDGIDTSLIFSRKYLERRWNGSHDTYSQVVEIYSVAYRKLKPHLILTFVFLCSILYLCCEIDYRVAGNERRSEYRPTFIRRL
jgi:hypothetical protein